MSNLVHIKAGSISIINYTGEMKHFGDTLAEAAKENPQLAQQVFAAFNELQVFQTSCAKGEEMIDVLLNP